MWACHNQAAFGGHLIRPLRVHLPLKGKALGAVHEIATGGRAALAMT